MEVSIAGIDEPEGAHGEATKGLPVTSNMRGAKRRLRRCIPATERPLWNGDIHRDTARRGDRLLR